MNLTKDENRYLELWEESQQIQRLMYRLAEENQSDAEKETKLKSLQKQCDNIASKIAKLPMDNNRKHIVLERYIKGEVQYKPTDEE